LEGIDFLYFIKKVQNSMTHHSFSGNEKSAFLLRQTLFNSLTGSVTIEKGIATTNNLLLISPVLTTKASGSINLLTKALDYQLQVSPLHKAKIPWVIHILISGDLQHPVVRVDELWLNDWMMREQFEQMKVKVKQNSQALPEKANQFINHLLRK
jgi:AsmA protein